MARWVGSPILLYCNVEAWHGRDGGPLYYTVLPPLKKGENSLEQSYPCCNSEVNEITIVLNLFQALYCVMAILLEGLGMSDVVHCVVMLQDVTITEHTLTCC